jgi:hypothetical protein
MSARVHFNKKRDFQFEHCDEAFGLKGDLSNH